MELLKCDGEHGFLQFVVHTELSLLLPFACSGVFPFPLIVHQRKFRPFQGFVMLAMSIKDSRDSESEIDTPPF